MGAAGQIILTATPPTPVFSGLTASQSITNGTMAITLAGQVIYRGSPSVYPASGESITVTINGNSQTTTINDATGDFSLSYNLSGIPASATPYTITYSYAGDADLNAANDTSTTLMVVAFPLTLSTTGSFIVPAGVTSLRVQMWGGGGGGGGTFGASSYPAGGGGGGGAYTLTTVSVTPGAMIEYSVGSGGAAGDALGANGDNGGNTTFPGAETANGGSGGFGGTLGSPNGAGASGGAAGTYNGGNGAQGVSGSSGRGGNGGDSAGTNSSGTSGNPVSPSFYRTSTNP